MFVVVLYDACGAHRNPALVTAHLIALSWVLSAKALDLPKFGGRLNFGVRMDILMYLFTDSADSVVAYLTHELCIRGFAKLAQHRVLC